MFVGEGVEDEGRDEAHSGSRESSQLVKGGSEFHRVFCGHTTFELIKVDAADFIGRDRVSAFLCRPSSLSSPHFCDGKFLRFFGDLRP